MKLFLFLAFVPVVFGQITGTIVDSSGSSVAQAHVQLLWNEHFPAMETDSSADGQFKFDVPDDAGGSFHLSISAKGFAGKTVSGELHPGESLDLPPTTLAIANLVSNVEVTQTKEEIAEQEIKTAEKQRLIGVLPNYLTVYTPDPTPLNAKQKFELTWKTTFDPTSFLISGIVAGVQQARNSYKDFGQGTEGYAKRYGANYATFFTGTVISSAILPTVFKQDPRYFYKGTGSKAARFRYAVSRAVICQGDNRKPQFCYSNILGGLASGALSNVFYPAANRDGLGLTFENTALGIASGALSNLFQEFLSRKLTPRKP